MRGFIRSFIYECRRSAAGYLVAMALILNRLRLPGLAHILRLRLNTLLHTIEIRPLFQAFMARERNLYRGLVLTMAIHPKNSRKATDYYFPSTHQTGHVGCFENFCNSWPVIGRKIIVRHFWGSWNGRCQYVWPVWYWSPLGGCCMPW